MSTINQKSQGIKEKSHANFMGGPSYDINDPILKLRIAASSCFFGEPMYYHTDGKSKSPVIGRARSRMLSDREINYLRETLDAIDPVEWRGLSPSKLMEKAIDEALEYDVEKTLQEAVRLRNDEFIRATPQVILVRAANHKNSKGTNLIRKYASKIIVRADEPATCFAYQMSAFGKPIPNSLKRAVGDRLSSFNDYNLAKYRLENKRYKTIDVVNMFRPKHTDSLKKLVEGKLTVTGETWEAIISEKGSSKETWEEALRKMGHMALLRNLRNLMQNGVDDSMFLHKLIDGVENGKQLPFRYYSAYRALKESSDKIPAHVLDAVETCMEKSIGALPRFSGKVMSLCDNSGSAQSATTSSMGSMQISTIGNLTGIVTGKASGEGYLGIFGDRLEVMPVRKKSSIFDQLEQADKVASGIGGSTENGIWLFWDKAIKEREHWDSVFIYSDMQAGHGGLYGVDAGSYSDYRWNRTTYIDVPKLIARYRNLVNPDVKVFLVQIAGYQDTIIPEFYDKTYILGGWGTGLLRFAKYVSENLTQ